MKKSQKKKINNNDIIPDNVIYVDFKANKKQYSFLSLRLRHNITKLSVRG